MNTICALTLYRKLLINILMFLMFIGIGFLNSGCATHPTISEPKNFYINLEGNSTDQKSIFVFLDGTGNDQTSVTNVWKLFRLIEKHKNLQTVGRYIEGVGSVNEPLEDDPIFSFYGDALGRGMQYRILEGYDFIAKNYNSGDEIFIIGFSRGAHQARALAGLLAYAGVPSAYKNNEKYKVKFEKILKLLKESRDEDFAEKWSSWKPKQAPLLAKSLKADRDIELDMQPVEIKFLGIWDTVPGSSFKEYDACKEQIGFWKRNFHWLPMISKGERYKSDSYPPIRYIAHAVSLDEKRSKFTPLYLCNAIKSEYTNLDEKWFPGAHADVGGGYANDDLPNISLNWMLSLLEKNYNFSSKPEVEIGNVKGLAHWSYGDGKASIGSDCENRLDREDRQPPLGYNPDTSIKERIQNGVVPVSIKGVCNDRDWKYPILCPGPEL
ncbi:MAG: DUF2235 domain-containing protein [Nitrosomonas sp.]